MTSSSIGIVAAVLVAALATALITARTLSAWLVRRRAGSLPADLAERLQEEWLAELEHMRSRASRLAFALRLFLTRRQTLIDATTATGAAAGHGGAVVVSVDALRILPDVRDQALAMRIDVGLLLVPVALGWYAAPSRMTFLLSSLISACLWILVVHVWAVRVWHATPGQRFSGIRIITLDDTPLQWRHIVRRLRSVLLGLLLAAVGFVMPLRPGTTGDAGEVVFWSCILLVGWHPRPLPWFATSTTEVMNIPTVVGVPGAGPERTTSLAR
jgi:hypothetical protein